MRFLAVKCNLQNVQPSKWERAHVLSINDYLGRELRMWRVYSRAQKCHGFLILVIILIYFFFDSITENMSSYVEIYRDVQSRERFWFHFQLINSTWTSSCNQLQYCDIFPRETKYRKDKKTKYTWLNLRAPPRHLLLTWRLKGSG